MKDFKFLPDDSKLTAYALGELEGDDRAAVENFLRGDAAARALVEEIRLVADDLTEVLEAEKHLPVDVPGRADPYKAANRSKVWRFPQFAFLVSGLAAACFAVVLALQEKPAASRGVLRKEYVQIALPSMEGAFPEQTQDAGAAPADSSITEPTPTFAVASELVPPVFDSNPLGLLDQAKELAERRFEGTGSRAIETPPVFSVRYADSPGLGAGRIARGEMPVGGAQSENVVRSPKSGVARFSGAHGFYGASSQNVVARKEALAVSHFFPAESFARRYTLAGAIVASGISEETDALRSFGRQSIPNTESYAYRRESDFVKVTDDPLSTFSADVDTASFANVRRMLAHGQRPPIDAVRIEEMLNYFPYAYAKPKKDVPFAVTMEVAEAPWAEGHQLVRIGLKAREVAVAERAAANLVFLLDVSGSMDEPNKLPLLQESMRLLVGKLRADDRVAIVTYAGTSGLALPSTPVAKKADILAALAELRAGGSTGGSRGIELAYDIAKANFVSGGINRVILCTDGDFNVGVTSEGELVRLIQDRAQSGVFLTVLGFGMGNLNDSTMQQLADQGNGNYGYVDSRREAEKLLVEQVSGTLMTIAKDVKLQVEFNPEKVASYRLIGYEKRALNKRDFANDKIDAGDVGAGHTVTALYEIVPVSAVNAATQKRHEEQELRYAVFSAAPATIRRAPAEAANELLTLRIRYKEPAAFLSKKLEFSLKEANGRFADASADFKFVAAVAGFGMILRDSAYKGTATMKDVIEWADAGSASDPGGYRAEFVALMQQAKTLL